MTALKGFDFSGKQLWRLREAFTMSRLSLRSSCNSVCDASHYSYDNPVSTCCRHQRISLADSPTTYARPASSNRRPTCQTTVTNFATTTCRSTTCFATTCIHRRSRTRVSRVLGFRLCSKRTWKCLRLLDQVQTWQDLHCET